MRAGNKGSPRAHLRAERSWLTSNRGARHPCIVEGVATRAQGRVPPSHLAIGLAAIAAWLVHAALLAARGISRAPLAGGAVTPVNTTTGNTGLLVLDGAYLYWWNRDGGIYKQPK